MRASIAFGSIFILVALGLEGTFGVRVRSRGSSSTTTSKSKRLNKGPRTRTPLQHYLGHTGQHELNCRNTTACEITLICNSPEKVCENGRNENGTPWEFTIFIKYTNDENHSSITEKVLGKSIICCRPSSAWLLTPSQLRGESKGRQRNQGSRASGADGQGKKAANKSKVPPVTRDSSEDEKLAMDAKLKQIEDEERSKKEAALEVEKARIALEHEAEVQKLEAELRMSELNPEIQNLETNNLKKNVAKPATKSQIESKPDSTGANNLVKVKVKKSKVNGETRECGILEDDGPTSTGGPKHRPWLVALIREGGQSHEVNQNHFCGGALIAEEHIMTSAQCVDKSTHAHDLAILRLDGSAYYSEEIRPICLPFTSNQFDGHLGTMRGWGPLFWEAKPTVYSSLAEVSIPIWTNDKCQKAYSKVLPGLKIEDSMLCAGGDATSGDKCQGDPGVSFEVLVDGRWTALGTGSWAHSQCVNPEVPGVYTRVSSHAYWLNKYVPLNMENIAPNT